MMRAIEEKIIDYLRNNDFLDYPKLDNSKNLSMRDSVDISSNEKRVYLWGHCIFTVTKENVITFSLCGWQTSTTKGRINALLKAFSSCNAGIYQKNGYLIFTSGAGEFPIDSNRVYMVVDGKPEATTDL